MQARITTTVGSPRRALGTKPAGPPVRPPGGRSAPAGPPPAPGGGLVNEAVPAPPQPLSTAPSVARVYGGATDGMGSGQGGMAIHPSLRSHNIGGREVRHTSKTR